MFWPCLQPHQTYLLWLLLSDQPVPEQYLAHKEKLCTLFEAEVNANTEARRKQTGVGG
jgi:hypothetical protein